MYEVFRTDRLIDMWLAEDIECGELTALVMIEANETGAFFMNARAELIVAGIDVAARVVKRYDPTLNVVVHVRDGDRVKKGAVLLVVRGNARSLLSVERTTLNIVRRMSSIANLTAEYVKVVADTHKRMVDTPKTTPALLMLEKEAVICARSLPMARAGKNRPLPTASLYERLWHNRKASSPALGVGASPELHEKPVLRRTLAPA
ncbi:Quinolinate phosphoribosyl transferase, N-terminal domain [Burkholderia sp. D7]|nr:Quinolinate phosphoribosyl transferase, N-terminal domain [Burkholderia sp. D7]